MSNIDISTNNGGQNLPAELILHILDHLNPNSGDDRPTLAHCALISTEFRHEAQKRLFSSVTLTYFIGTLESHGGYGQNKKTVVDTTQTNHFLLAITGSPSLTTFIQRLVIRLEQKMDPSHVNLRSPEGSSSLPKILLRMTNLKVFNWITPEPKLNIHWETFTESMPSIQSSIQAVLQMNNLREIKLTGLRWVPFSLLLSSSDLKALVVTDLVYDETQPLSSVSQPPQSIALTTFTVRALYRRLGMLVKSLQSPKCPITLSKLESLEITMACRPERGQVHALLDLCAKSLTHLKWIISCQLLPVTNPLLANLGVDLSNLAKLTHLHLLGSVEKRWSTQGLQFGELGASALPSIGSTLESLPGTKISSLTLIIKIYLLNLSLNAVAIIPWEILIDGLQIPDRTYKSLTVSLVFTDHHLPEEILADDPDLPQKRIDMLKDNFQLKKLGDALVFDT